MLVREAERLASRILSEAGRDSPGLSARLLLANVLETDKTGVLLKAEQSLSENQKERFFHLVLRRKKGEPLAYLLGVREFYGLDFQVNAATLIPRPESEHLVDCVLAHEDGQKPLFFADLGCGSGNLGIALASNRPLWRGLLLDICSETLLQARANTKKHKLEERLSCLRADLARLPCAEQSLHFLVANPPYIAAEERDLVMDEVLDFEPHLALFAEDHGYAQLQAAIAQACEHLVPNGHIYLEHGANQAGRVRELLQQNFTDVGTLRDLAGHERVSFGRLQTASMR
ncbi:MAG: peptide chain release factor N(5)-glutamine methyltransferase [Desulfovibrio sp.]|nr:peptide chain release factor N(5)-glutamine methyltransferase [Desulfovibrio sp.]